MELLARGREADVFTLDQDTVLRRCHDSRARCEPAAALMEWVHAGGYPVPRVHWVDGPKMVLDRVSGPTLLDSLASGTTTAAAGGALLADLHHRLHALAPPPGTEPGLVVRHLDLHPGNVMLASSGPVVIDWRNSDAGVAAVDVALSGLILAEVVCGRGPYAGPARAVLDAYLSTIGPVDEPAAEAARRYRAADPLLSEPEKALLSTATTLLRRTRH